MKRNVSILVLTAILAYLLSYVWFRQSHIEIWEKDNKAYVIFPADRIYFYYLYRPLTLIDGKITAMQFHIGEHK